MRTHLEAEGLEEYIAIFNRDGWYYDRLNNRTWYEFDGWGWEPKEADDGVAMFLHELEHLNTRWLEPTVVEAIKVLIDAKVCKRQLRQLLRSHEDNVGVRDVIRRFRKHNLLRTLAKGITPRFRTL